MSFCLLPEKAEAFKQALRNTDIGKLINMSTADRTAFFKQFADGPAEAKEINTAFEQKLVLKNRILGIQNLVQKLAQVGKDSPEKVAERNQAIQDYKDAQTKRIFSPAEHEAFLNDLADKKVGTHIDEATANKVYELTKTMQDAKDEGTDNLTGMSDKYLEARMNLNHFIEAQKPLGALGAIGKNLTTTMRNFMLMNPATPLKTTESQVVNSLTDNITRRIGNMALGGKSGDLAKTAYKEAQQTFKTTGANVASMESADDIHALGKGENFGVSNHSNTGAAAPLRAVEAVTGAAAKATTKVAIDFEHNISFTHFYQKTFFDSANILATKLARTEGLKGDDLNARADEIFKDAARIEPETEAGRIVRTQSQLQAARVTNTNDTWVSKLALGFKNSINKVLPGVGDVVYPIARIPSNIIANGIDSAGGGIPTAFKDVMQGRVKLQSPDLNTRYEGAAQLANGIQRTARIAGTLSTAAFLSSQFNDKDFRTDAYGNHFFKVGNTWINSEYLGFVGPAFAGMMSDKINKANGPVENAIGYGFGTAQALEGAPTFDFGTSIANALKSKDPTSTMSKDIQTFFESRDQPAFLSNLTKTRPVNRLLFGANGIESQEDVNDDTAAAAQKAAITRAQNAKKK